MKFIFRPKKRICSNIQFGTMFHKIIKQKGNCTSNQRQHKQNYSTYMHNNLHMRIFHFHSTHNTKTKANRKPISLRIQFTFVLIDFSLLLYPIPQKWLKQLIYHFYKTVNRFCDVERKCSKPYCTLIVKRHSWTASKPKSHSWDTIYNNNRTFLASSLKRNQFQLNFASSIKILRHWIYWRIGQ